MNWIFKKFNELSVFELYAIVQLRETVFVVEQECAFLDCDGVDINSFHLMLFENEELIAYLRIIPAKFYADNKVSIGRVVVKPSHRGKNLGKLIFVKGMECVKQLYGNNCTVSISAQYRLEKFYADLDFVSVGDIYLEDNIEHIKMLGTTN